MPTGKDEIAGINQKRQHKTRRGWVHRVQRFASNGEKFILRRGAEDKEVWPFNESLSSLHAL